MNIDNERRAFEAWAESKGYLVDHIKGRYEQTATRIAYEGWLARAEADPVIDEAMINRAVKTMYQCAHKHFFANANGIRDQRKEMREILEAALAPPKEASSGGS